MIITFNYCLYTDGDFSLRNSEKFGCIGQDIETEEEYYDYIGEMTIEHNDSSRCKINMRSFLEQFLCDGIHVSYTHYYLLRDFYEIIDNMISFINQNDNGVSYRQLGGNYSGTYFSIKIM